MYVGKTEIIVVLTHLKRWRPEAAVHIHTDRQTDRHTDRHADMHADRHRDRQTGKKRQRNAKVKLLRDSAAANHLAPFCNPMYMCMTTGIHIWTER
jgi:hypothetical protein